MAALLSVGAHLAGLQALRSVPLTSQALGRQLWLWLLADGLWLVLLLSLWRMDAQARRAADAGAVEPLPADAARPVELAWLGRLWIVVLALAMRLPALMLPTVHSADAVRYLWDGAVQRAGQNPYLDPPEAERYRGVQQEQPALFAAINHRHLPTIYPPVAQAAFRLSAWLGSAGEPASVALRRWKILCGTCEILLLALLWAQIKRRALDERWLSLWALCPLPAIEIWLNGHLDALGLLAVVGLVALWPRRAGTTTEPLRAAWGAGAVWALAVLVKPLALCALPALRGLSRPTVRRFIAAGLVTAAVVWLPYREAGLHVTPSLGEYGRRWRSNDGAFALVQGAVQQAVDVAYRPPYWEPWRFPALARLVSGRVRDTVWPDELVGFVARAVVAIPLLLLLWWVWRRRLAVDRGLLLLLTGYALWTPVLHPWYLLWPLLLAPLWRPAALPVILLAALAPLAYVPLLRELTGGAYSETIWARLLQHGAAWGAVACTLPRLMRTLQAEAEPRPGAGQ